MIKRRNKNKSRPEAHFGSIEMRCEVDPAYHKVKALLDGLNGKAKATQPELKEMFALYNTIFVRKEHGTTCGSCVARVYKYLKMWYAKKTEEYGLDG